MARRWRVVSSSSSGRCSVTHTHVDETGPEPPHARTHARPGQDGDAGRKRVCGAARSHAAHTRSSIAGDPPGRPKKCRSTSLGVFSSCFLSRFPALERCLFIPTAPVLSRVESSRFLLSFLRSRGRCRLRALPILVSIGAPSYP